MHTVYKKLFILLFLQGAMGAASYAASTDSEGFKSPVKLNVSRIDVSDEEDISDSESPRTQKEKAKQNISEHASKLIAELDKMKEQKYAARDSKIAEGILIDLKSAVRELDQKDQSHSALLKLKFVPSKKITDSVLKEMKATARKYLTS